MICSKMLAAEGSRQPSEWGFSTACNPRIERLLFVSAAVVSKVVISAFGLVSRCPRLSWERIKV